jgi:hypothetical protein
MATLAVARVLTLRALRRADGRAKLAISLAASATASRCTRSCSIK